MIKFTLLFNSHPPHISIYHQPISHNLSEYLCELLFYRDFAGNFRIVKLSKIAIAIFVMDRSKENVNPVATRQVLEQDNINPSSSRQSFKQEESISPNRSRQALKQKNIDPNITSQPSPQQHFTPVPPYLNVNQSEHKEQGEFEPQGIFVYGTLMAEEFLSWVLTGSAENHKTIVSLRQPATLRSYRRVAVVHADYPALIPGDESDKVEGFLVMPSTRSQWKKLDDFEGECYRRQRVQVEVSSDSSDASDSGNRITTTTNTAMCTRVPAFVYLWQDSMDKLLLDQLWSYEYFREHRLEDWLDLFEGMEMVGEGWSFLVLLPYPRTLP